MFAGGGVSSNACTASVDSSSIRSSRTSSVALLEPCEGKRARVGIATNTEGVARLTREEAHSFEQHTDTPVVEWVNLAQIPDLRDVLNGGPGNMTGSLGCHVPTRPHHLDQHRRIGDP